MFNVFTLIALVKMEATYYWYFSIVIVFGLQLCLACGTIRQTKLNLAGVYFGLLHR